MKLPGIEYKSPLKFTWKQHLALFFLPPVIAFLIKLLYRSTKFEVRGQEIFDNTLASHGNAILALWHECSTTVVYHTRNHNYHTLGSYSFDAEMGARIVSRFGTEAVRGSSSRGGSLGLRELEKVLRLVQCVGITVDGPRGPRRIAKAGAAILAARTQSPILPVAVAMSPCWRLRSWDRFPIPKPRARILLHFGEALLPPEHDNPDSVEALRINMESALNDLHIALEKEIGDEEAFSTG